MFHIVLVNPEIPQNTGNIGRLAVCTGCTLHLIRPLGFSLDESDIRRAGLDYWPYLDYRVYDCWRDFTDTQSPENIIFASTKGKKSLFSYNFNGNEYLVFGNESRGLPPGFYQRYSDDLYALPLPGNSARSLNLANAAAVVVYEGMRQTQIV